MSSINKSSLLVAAVLSSAITALGQNRGSNPNDANPPESGTRESDSRPERPGASRNTIQDANVPTTDTNDTYRSRPSRAGSVDDMNPPKRKRSFWDRLFGRNKQLDAETAPRPNDEPARGVESRP